MIEINKEQLLEPIDKRLLIQDYCMKCNKHVNVVATFDTDEHCNLYDKSCYDVVFVCERIKLNKKLKKIRNAPNA
jgi:hypothetical protein